MTTSYLRAIAPERRGYDGLFLHLLYWDHEHARKIPPLLWRLYWGLQPLRCLLNFHKWYDTAAGLCSGCACCGVSTGHSNSVMRKYRWRPWMRELASLLEEAENARDVFFESWQDGARDFAHYAEAHP